MSTGESIEHQIERAEADLAEVREQLRRGRVKQAGLEQAVVLFVADPVAPRSWRVVNLAWGDERPPRRFDPGSIEHT